MLIETNQRPQRITWTVAKLWDRALLGQMVDERERMLLLLEKYQDDFGREFREYAEPLLRGDWGHILKWRGKIKHGDWIGNRSADKPPHEYWQSVRLLFALSRGSQCQRCRTVETSKSPLRLHHAIAEQDYPSLLCVELAYPEWMERLCKECNDRHHIDKTFQKLQKLFQQHCDDQTKEIEKLTVRITELERMLHEKGFKKDARA